mmetsp:Transcript_87175/g.219495  ORF Transcript_87175/g.219495 Transcript_87175/m.219495 type:complete len:88 (+) Transcript_87175:345-608(+)
MAGCALLPQLCPRHLGLQPLRPVERLPARAGRGDGGRRPIRTHGSGGDEAQRRGAGEDRGQKELARLFAVVMVILSRSLHRKGGARQ